MNTTLSQNNFLTPQKKKVYKLIIEIKIDKNNYRKSNLIFNFFNN